MLLFMLATLKEEQQHLVEDLFRKHHKHFLSVARKIVPNDFLANDAVSHAFEKIILHIDKISSLPCPLALPYCVSIVKNAAFDLHLQNKKTVLTEDFSYLADVEKPSVVEMLTHWEEVERITKLIHTLPAKDQEFIRLRYAHEKGLSEVAMALGITEEAAKKRGQRLVKRLREILLKEDDHV